MIIKSPLIQMIKLQESICKFKEEEKQLFDKTWKTIFKPLKEWRRILELQKKGLFDKLMQNLYVELQMAMAGIFQSEKNLKKIYDIKDRNRFYLANCDLLFGLKGFNYGSNKLLPNHNYQLFTEPKFRTDSPMARRWESSDIVEINQKQTELRFVKSRSLYNGFNSKVSDNTYYLNISIKRNNVIQQIGNHSSYTDKPNTVGMKSLPAYNDSEFKKLVESHKKKEEKLKPETKPKQKQKQKQKS